MCASKSKNAIWNAIHDFWCSSTRASSAPNARWIVRCGKSADNVTLPQIGIGGAGHAKDYAWLTILGPVAGSPAWPTISVATSASRVRCTPGCNWALGASQCECWNLATVSVLHIKFLPPGIKTLRRGRDGTRYATAHRHHRNRKAPASSLNQ